MQKTWIIRYRPKGNNYKFMTPYTATTVARTKAEAKENIFFKIGDMYCIVEIKEQEI